MSQLIANEISLSQSLDKKSPSPILYKYRYVIGLLFILVANNNMIAISIFSPLQTTLATVYDESLTYINFATGLVATVCYIPANFIGNYVVEKYGLRSTFLIGSLLNTAGLWARCLSRHGFTGIFVGQILVGFAQPLYMMTPPTVANIWFGAHERMLASTVLLMSTNIGATLSTVVPQFFVNIYADNITIIEQIHTMMIWFAIIGSFSFALLILLMRDKPPTPPSKAAVAIKYNFLDSLKTIVKDWNTVGLILSTVLVYGTYITYIGTLQMILEPFGIDGNKAGDLLSISMIVSMIGSIAFAPLLGRYRKFNRVLIMMSLLSLAVLVGNLFAAQSTNFYLFGASVLVYSVLMVPVFPVSIEYSIEMSFPVAESMVSGLWYVLAYVLSTVESLAVDQILGNNPTIGTARWAFIALLLFQAVGMIPLFWIKENHKRTKFEQEQALNKIADNSNSDCLE